MISFMRSLSFSRDRWRARSRKTKAKEDVREATLNALIIEDDPDKATRRTVHWLTVERTGSKSWGGKKTKLLKS